jgi:spore germination protein YaaH
MLLLIMLINCKTGKIETVTEEDETLAPVEEVLPFIHEPGKALNVTSFKEIWGYVITGQEAALKKEIPLTDVGYFGAEVDMYGTLANVPRRQNLASFTGRVHLVVTCGTNALTYFTLLPGSSQRKQLISDLIAATRNYDGLNIDFENIPPKSGEAFLSFLRELKQGLPADKIFSVCLYGRPRKFQNDVYDYEIITPLADKVFIMAYDEHWGGGPPGPVASLRWCRSVANHSMRTIGGEKLVMGIPLYGRAWESQNHSRALIFTTTERLINTHNVKDVKYDNGIPTFEYSPDVKVKVFYEDEYSVSARLEMYKSMGVNAVGFWRIGQETPKVWNLLKIE